MLRPGGHLRADSALRALRDKGVPAEPISVVPRSGRGADGRVVWYSSLMVDVARLVRAGHLGTGGALTRLATLTASARARLLPDLRIETFAGRVADGAGRVAFVVDEDGRSLPLPAPSGSPMAWAGALVIVDTEELSGGATTVWVRPAFDPAADLNERVPGGPHLLTPAERDRLSRPVATTR